MSRERLRDARRVVVKVGTSTVADAGGRLTQAKIDRIADEVSGAIAGGREVVLVSSGAIAGGIAPLGFARRPQDLPTLQACAAVGQSYLMHAYATAFRDRGHVCAQILLTRMDVVHRQQYVNALHTLQRLLALGAVPVVNENDTVATDEIGFGENDLLAALVANLVRADALLLLSDVDGLHDADSRVVSEVEGVTADVEALARGKGSTLASGGMRTKLDAAKIAGRSGVSTVIARFRKGILEAALDGRPVGTLFHAQPSRLRSRKAWIAFATVPAGTIVVDDGARLAVVERKRSLLAAGVRSVSGTFSAGDVVEVADESGMVFARGIASLSAAELSSGGRFVKEAVHRDALVVL